MIDNHHRPVGHTQFAKGLCEGIDGRQFRAEAARIRDGNVFETYQAGARDVPFVKVRGSAHVEHYDIGIPESLFQPRSGNEHFLRWNERYKPG